MLSYRGCQLTGRIAHTKNRKQLLRTGEKDSQPWDKRRGSFISCHVGLHQRRAAWNLEVMENSKAQAGPGLLTLL